MSNWYAIRTATRRESTAYDGLVERKFTPFLPMSTHWRRSARKGEVKVDRPLFPGYIFVLCRPEDMPGILKIEACSQFVRYVVNDELTPVIFPPGEIIKVQAAECRGEYDYTRKTAPKTKPTYRRGDKIRVVAGPWQTFVGKVLSTPTRDRIHVMIEGPHGRGVGLDVAQVAAA
jgi:transcription antitermination factor NusG